MGLFEQFPYANFHELNLDWILKKIKELNEMGVKCCSLGNRILRSETAPLYLMSVIGYTRELVK